MSSLGWDQSGWYVERGSELLCNVRQHGRMRKFWLCLDTPDRIRVPLPTLMRTAPLGRRAGQSARVVVMTRTQIVTIENVCGVLGAWQDCDQDVAPGQKGLQGLLVGGRVVLGGD
jgi:hypothetical protein